MSTWAARSQASQVRKTENATARAIREVSRNGPWERLVWTQRTLGRVNDTWRGTKIPVALESARTRLGTRQVPGDVVFVARFPSKRRFFNEIATN